MTGRKRGKTVYGNDLYSHISEEEAQQAILRLEQDKAVEQDVTSGEFLKSSEHIVLTKFFNHVFENDMAQICYCTITEEKRPKE